MLVARTLPPSPSYAHSGCCSLLGPIPYASPEHPCCISFPLSCDLCTTPPPNYLSAALSFFLKTPSTNPSLIRLVFLSRPFVQHSFLPVPPSEPSPSLSTLQGLYIYLPLRVCDCSLRLFRVCFHADFVISQSDSHSLNLISQNRKTKQNKTQ